MKSNVNDIISRMKSLGFYMIRWSLDNTDILFINTDWHKIAANDHYIFMVKKYYYGTRRIISRVFCNA